MAKSKIAIVGSLNVDFITRTPRMPAAGETLTAESFESGFGGKGANQAVACARLANRDVSVQMVGHVGDDSFGSEYLVALEKEGIDASGVRKVAGQKTGIANIIVEGDTGENRILLAPNANHVLPHPSFDLLPEDTDVVVFQLEIPPTLVFHNIYKASEKGMHVILNPAPAMKLPDEIYNAVDTLILNEGEAELCFGSYRLPNVLASLLLQRGVKDAVIITLGAKGLIYTTKSGADGHIPAQKVSVVDTTAAGDTFVGAYAVQRAKAGNGAFDHERALMFATLAASKTVEKKGAMAAIPCLLDM